LLFKKFADLIRHHTKKAGAKVQRKNDIRQGEDEKKTKKMQFSCVIEEK